MAGQLSLPIQLSLLGI